LSKVLVVDDDHDLTSTLRDWLELENYLVEVANTGQDALHLMAGYSYDLIILDVHLPDMTGIEICRKYRSSGGSALILMLTAKSKVAEKTEGLDAGADDYLTKPFHMQELAARLRSLMRRPRTNANAQTIKFADIEIEVSTHKVKRAGKDISLQRMEFLLLQFLLEHPGQIFSADALLDKVWPDDKERSAATMRALVTKLREKIGEPVLIKNVHGLGYKLEEN